MRKSPLQRERNRVEANANDEDMCARRCKGMPAGAATGGFSRFQVMSAESVSVQEIGDVARRKRRAEA